MRNKIVLILLGFLFTLTVPMPTFANADITFSDISGHWAENYIIAAMENQIVVGYYDNTFRPDGNITRAEMVVILNRFFNLFAEGERGFTDVSEYDWFYNYVMVATNYGYIVGFGDGSFGPNTNLTRLRLTTMTYRIISPDIDTDTSVLYTLFEDAAYISYPYNRHVSHFVELDVLRGFYDATLRMDSYITRAEVVAFLMRFSALEMTNNDATPPVILPPILGGGGGNAGGGGGQQQQPPSAQPAVMTGFEVMTGYAIRITFDRNLTTANLPTINFESEVGAEVQILAIHIESGGSSVIVLITPMYVGEQYRMRLSSTSGSAAFVGIPSIELLEANNITTRIYNYGEKYAWSIRADIPRHSELSHLQGFDGIFTNLRFVIRVTLAGNPVTSYDVAIMSESTPLLFLNGIFTTSNFNITGAYISIPLTVNFNTLGTYEFDVHIDR
ncbi:MAG: S-layer homology domain-containing protein [Oscillospiraceae bacterium]|nr:S-layer homology domain-containing protein [Oscillospiraceae bacterium]